MVIIDHRLTDDSTTMVLVILYLIIPLLVSLIRPTDITAQSPLLSRLSKRFSQF